MRLKARMTPYSSTVGGGLVLLDDKGLVHFNILLCGQTRGISKEQNDQISRQLLDAINAHGVMVTS